MAVNDIGRVVPIWRGIYNPETAYELNDIVLDAEGSVWWHVADEVTVGTAPGSGEVWAAVIDMSVFSASIQAAIAEAQEAVREAEEAVGTLAGYAERAEEAAEAASNSAGSAAGFATAASDEKREAEAARAGAETAQAGAETAQAAAEAAQTSAETAQTGAEAAQTAAQTAKSGAEAARDMALTYQQSAAASKDAAKLARDKAEEYAEALEVQIDPTFKTPGTAAESVAVSKKTASAVVGTAAGNAAAFPDAAGERVLRSVRVNIEPVQAGSGDPSPDNVRAISGWTRAKVTQCGKNLFDLSAAEGGYIDTAGLPHRTTDVVTNWTISDYMPVNPGTVMYVLAQTAANAARHAFYDAGLSCVGVATVDGSSLTVPAGARWVRCSIRKANEETFTFSALPDAAAGYDAQVFDISFPSEAGTVYGGVLDLTAGTLTVTHGFRQFSGADVTDYGSTTLGVFYVKLVPAAGISSSGTVHSDRYMVYRSTANRKSGDIAVQATGQVYVYDDRFTSQAAAEQILDTETPVIVYPLASPVVYQLTPVQIAALAGANTVFADCGAVEIEYVRDTGMVIEAGDASTRAMIGEVSGTTASRSLAVGEYVTVGDALYRVTRAVGSGETLVPGTNVTETTVGAELARIAAMIS